MWSLHYSWLVMIKVGIGRRILLKLSIIKFNENLFNGSQADTCGLLVGHSDNYGEANKCHSCTCRSESGINIRQRLSLMRCFSMCFSCYIICCFQYNVLSSVFAWTIPTAERVNPWKLTPQSLVLPLPSELTPPKWNLRIESALNRTSWSHWNWDPRI